MSSRPLGSGSASIRTATAMAKRRRPSADIIPLLRDGTIPLAHGGFAPPGFRLKDHAGLAAGVDFQSIHFLNLKVDVVHPLLGQNPPQLLANRAADGLFFV